MHNSEQAPQKQEAPAQDPSNLENVAIAPIFKKGDPRNVEIFRPISLLCIDGKIFKKCGYNPLYNHCRMYLSENKNEFVLKISVRTNTRFLVNFYSTLDQDPKL